MTSQRKADGGPAQKLEDELVEQSMAEMTPERMRELVRFMISVSVAAIRAGAGEDENIPQFIEELGRRAHSHALLVEALDSLLVAVTTSPGASATASAITRARAALASAQPTEGK